MVDASRFDNRVQGLPANIVAGIALFVLIAVLLAPYLRIALGGPLASVSRLFVGYLLSAGVLSTGVMVILILWATLGRSILETSEYTAQRVAEKIEVDVRNELIDMLKSYQDLKKLPALTANIGLSKCPYTVEFEGEYVAQNPHNESDPTFYRPPYRVQFFVDENGNSIDGDYSSCLNSPMGKVDISGRKYFKLARENGLGLNKFRGNQVVNTLPAFAIERILGYSTGLPSVALAIPEQRFGHQNPRDKARVGVISGPLQSLSSPVLPSGFHYAIIENDTGLVIAHDNEGRVLVEDFFQESDDNPEILASVKRRQSKTIDGKYHGRASFFHARPIPDLPWSVIVIQDKSLIQMARFEIAAIALGELLLIFMVVGVCIAATVIFWQREPWTWLWPMRRHILECHPSVFWVALIVLSIVILFGAILICYLEGVWLIFWTVVTILSGAHLMYLVSVQPLDVKILSHRRWRTPAVLVLLLFFSLVLFSTAKENLVGGAESLPLLDLLSFSMLGLIIIVILVWAVPSLLKVLWDSKNIGHSSSSGQNTRDDDKASKPIVSESARRFRHVAAGVLCLLMFGGLPAGAAFKDSYTTYMELIFRNSVLDTAEGFEQRLSSMRNYIGSLDQTKSDEGGLDWTRKYTFPPDTKSRGVFVSDSLLNAKGTDFMPLQAFYKPTNSLQQCIEHGGKKAIKGLSSFFISKIPPSSESMARLYLMSSQADKNTIWCRDAGNSSMQNILNYRVINGTSGEDRGKTQRMQLTLDATDFYALSPHHVVRFILFSALYIGVLYFQVGVIGARLGGTRIHFILNRSGQPRPNDGKLNLGDLCFKQRMVLRAPNAVVYSAVPTSPLVKCKILKLDSASERDFNDLQKDLDLYPDMEIKILHLNLLLDDEKQKGTILPLLESLVCDNLDRNMTIYVDYNPLYRLTRPDAYCDSTSTDNEGLRNTESLRWSSLLSKFAKEYAWSPRDNPDWLAWKDKKKAGELTCAREGRIFHPDSQIQQLLKEKFEYARQEGFYGSNEDIPAEDIVALAAELGGTYYRKLWEECTHNERVLLHSLAARRCVNTLNVEIINHLMRRGLVVLEPSLSLVNDSFAEFIREAETPETYHQWQHDEQEKGAWQALRVPFLFLLFVPIAVLLVVATEELNRGIALMAPILTVIPLLMKGFGLRPPADS